MTGGAVLLAAGFSRRFGSDKRRHRLPDGTPLLLKSLALYQQSFPALVVVLRDEDDDLAAMLAAADGGIRIVRCAEAHLGMGHSLAWGARAAQDWDYLFVALGDMAWVRLQTLVQLRTLLETAGPDAIVQPTYRGTPGHPVGFGRHHLTALTTLTGDEGARRLVKAAGDKLIRTPVDDPGVLEDLDEPRQAP